MISIQNRPEVHSQLTAMVENYLLGATNQTEVLEALSSFDGDLSTVVTDSLTVVALQHRQYPPTVTPGLRQIFDHFTDRLNKVDIAHCGQPDAELKPKQIVETIIFLDMLEDLIPQISEHSMTATFAPVMAAQ